MIKLQKDLIWLKELNFFGSSAYEQFTVRFDGNRLAPRLLGILGASTDGKLFCVYRNCVLREAGVSEVQPEGLQMLCILAFYLLHSLLPSLQL